MHTTGERYSEPFGRFWVNRSYDEPDLARAAVDLAGPEFRRIWSNLSCG